MFFYFYAASNIEVGVVGLGLMGSQFDGWAPATREGKLVSVVAGNKETFEKIKTVIETVAHSIFYIGHIDGSANALKLALNLNIALIASALSEGITLVKYIILVSIRKFLLKS